MEDRRLLAALLLAAATAACTDLPPASGPRDLLPAPLAVLRLAEDSDEITPVDFAHEAHAARALAAGGGCADCHHPLREDPAGVPAACTACHPRHAEPGSPPDL